MRACHHPNQQNARRYEFEQMHPTSKHFGMNTDFVLNGYESLALLLWWGDLKSMRAGMAKVVDGHRRLLDQVRQSKATADGCARDICVPDMCVCMLDIVQTYIHRIS